MEDDPAILDLRVDSNDNNEKTYEDSTDDESEDDWEDVNEKTDYDVPRKKTKKQPTPKLENQDHFSILIWALQTTFAK